MTDGLRLHCQIVCLLGLIDFFLILNHLLVKNYNHSRLETLVKFIAMLKQLLWSLQDRLGIFQIYFPLKYEVTPCHC